MRRTDPRVEILSALGDFGELATVPYVVDLLLARGTTGEAARRVTSSILERATGVELARLEPQVRMWSRWNGSSDRWLRADAATILHATPEDAHRLPYLGLASFHPSGHVREAAVRQLADEASGREISYLVLRLNDWVAPVRRLAEAAIEHRLSPRHADAWVDVLPLVLRLREQGRHHATHIVRAVFALATDRDTAFDVALASPDQTVRRAAHEIARDAGGEAFARAARAALDEPTPIVRIELAKAIRAGAAVDPDIEDALLRDPSMAVRRETLLTLVERDDSRADAALDAAVLDASRSVREVARYFIAKRAGAPVDVAERYREPLRAPGAGRATVCAALGGLAETGTSADAALASSWLGDARPSVRADTLRAVAHLDAPHYADAIRVALLDPSPRVARAATRVVEDGVAGIELEATLPPILFDGAPSVQRHRLRALAGLPHWRALPHLLRATSMPTLADSAIDLLRAWVDHGASHMFVSPSGAEARACRLALGDAHDAVPDELVGEIDAALRRWS